MREESYAARGNGRGWVESTAKMSMREACTASAGPMPAHSDAWPPALSNSPADPRKESLLDDVCCTSLTVSKGCPTMHPETPAAQPATKLRVEDV